MNQKKKFYQMHPALIALIDTMLIALMLIGFALYDHVWPRPLNTEVNDITQKMMDRLQEAREARAAEEAAERERLIIGEQFVDRFTDGEPYWEGNTYTGRNLSVTFFSGQMNTSVYFVQDIYLRDIDCLKTAFGQDVYGKGYTEDFLSMAQRKKAVGAINGDFYYMGALGVIIRNGELYRDAVDPLESVLALFEDGTMEVYENGQFTVADLVSRGALQTWSFGPSLLDHNGRAKTEFTRKNPEANPRTVIGMVEPGHYMFIAVDGRQDGYSEGMTYVELAQLSEQLGLTVSYNLDGGGTTRMIFGDSVVNSPSEPRELSDIVYVADVY